MNHSGYGREKMERLHHGQAASDSSNFDRVNMPQRPPSQNHNMKSNVYSTAQTIWLSQELHLLHKGMNDFPTDKYDNITRYIKIAATIPDKSIRDVAYKIRCINIPQEHTTHDQPYNISSMEFMEPMVPLTLKKEVISQESSVKKTLQDNNVILNAMRANITAGQFRDNINLMTQFRDSCTVILRKLSGICSAVPPLPVQVDLSLLPDPGSNQNDV